jgi:predicted ATPase
VNRFVVISGCSGGGKSTLLAELGRRRHSIIEEPSRRIVVEEMNIFAFTGETKFSLTTAYAI